MAVCGSCEKQCSDRQVVSEITSWLHLGGALKQDSSVQELANATHGICAALERNVTPVSWKQILNFVFSDHFCKTSGNLAVTKELICQPIQMLGLAETI